MKLVFIQIEWFAHVLVKWVRCSFTFYSINQCVNRYMNKCTWVVASGPLNKTPLKTTDKEAARWTNATTSQLCVLFNKSIKILACVCLWFPFWLSFIFQGHRKTSLTYICAQYYHYKIFEYGIWISYLANITSWQKQPFCWGCNLACPGYSLHV